MPYAVSQGGWLSFTLVFVIVSIFCYTGHLIQQRMDADPSINSYGDIGAAAFGYKGRGAVAFIMYIEMYLTAVSFLIMEGDILDKFFPNTSIEPGSLTIKEKQLFILVAALIISPTTWLRDLSILAYFSAAGFSHHLSCSVLYYGLA